MRKDTSVLTIISSWIDKHSRAIPIAKRFRTGIAEVVEIHLDCRHSFTFTYFSNFTSVTELVSWAAIVKCVTTFNTTNSVCFMFVLIQLMCVPHLDEEDKAYHLILMKVKLTRIYFLCFANDFQPLIHAIKANNIIVSARPGLT